MQERSFTAEEFLASPSDLMKVLVHFADSSRKHSRQSRMDRISAQSALQELLTSSTNALLTTPESIPQNDSTPRMSAPGHSQAAPETAHPARPGEGVARVYRRQYCACGQCKWCLDNIRWNRIFEEKFADPGYYGAIRVRHNSTLSAVR